jgi:outer membrane protein TolC
MHGARVAALVLFLITSSHPIWPVEPSPVVTLTQCIAAALQSGPDIRLSEAALAVGQSQYAQAVAQNSMALSASGSAARKQPLPNNLPSGLAQADNPFTAQGGVNPNATDTGSASLTLANGSTNPATSVGVSVDHHVTENASLRQYTTVSVSASQTIWDGYAGGRAMAAVQQAGITLQGQRATARASRATAVASVKQAYYSLLADQRQIEVLQKTLDQRQAESERIATLAARQDATRIDVKQAEVNLVTARLDLAQAADTMEVDREKLSNLVGWPSDRPYTVADAGDLPVPGLDVDAAIRTALRQRADLEQLRLSRSAGGITLALRKSQFSPTVAATGGVSLVQDWSSGIAFPNLSAGLQVSLPITDAGLTDQLVREAELQNGAYDLQAGQLAASIATDVKSALYSLRNLIAREGLAESSLQLARDSYDLTSTQYEQGVSGNIDLLSASVALTTAEAALAKTRSDTQLGIVALQTAMGDTDGGEAAR